MTASHSSSESVDQHAVAHEAGVVDEDVEPAEACRARSPRGLGAVPVGDVVGVRDGLAARGDDLVDHLAAGPARRCRSRPSRPTPRSLTTTFAPWRGELQRVRAADAAARAGDDDDAVRRTSPMAGTPPWRGGPGSSTRRRWRRRGSRGRSPPPCGQKRRHRDVRGASGEPGTRRRSPDVSGSASRPSGDGAPTAAIAVLVAVVQVRPARCGSCPPTTAFTRTFGAHSTASVCVRLSSPALAAP